MCFFQGITFEMYTSEPRLKGDYYQPGETEQQHRKRMRERRQEAAARNHAINEHHRAAGRSVALRPRLKVLPSSPSEPEASPDRGVDGLNRKVAE